MVVSGLRSGNSASASSDGSLREQPLSPETREQYVAQWAAVQEQFVHLTVEGRHRGGRAAGAPGRGARLPRRRAVRGAVGRPLRPPRLLRPGLPQHAHSSPRPERHRGDAGGYRRSPRPLRGTGHRRAGRPGPAPTRSYFPQGERDELALRLQQALSTFVDSPCQAVGEADAIFDEIATYLTNTLTEQRRVLRELAGPGQRSADRGTTARAEAVPGDHRTATAHVSACRSVTLSQVAPSAWGWGVSSRTGTDTACAQTGFGHGATDRRGIRTPCSRGPSAAAGQDHPCRSAWVGEGRAGWRNLVPRPPRAVSLWFSGGTPAAARRPGSDVRDRGGPGYVMR